MAEIQLNQVAQQNVDLISGFRNTIVLLWALDIRSPPAQVASPLHYTRAFIHPIRGASMSHYSRREFLKTGLAAGAFAATASLPLSAARQTATD